MKRILAVTFITLFALAFVISCTNTGKQQEVVALDTTYTLKITLVGLDSGVLLLSYRDGDNRKTDSAKSTTGVYAFAGKMAEPKRAMLRVLGDEKNDVLAFYLENGTIEIQAVKDSLANALAAGSKTNNDNRELRQQTASVKERLNVFMKAYATADKKNKPLLDSLEKTYDLIDADQKKVTTEFIKTHPGSFVSVYEIMDIYSYNPDVPKFDSAVQVLDSAVRASSIGKKMEEMLRIAKMTDINQIAPDFTMADVKGTPVTLSSLRGKYLLIDFWASWCGPCRRENPNLVKTYNRFSKKGFSVVGVSLDEAGDQDKWIAAIKKDKLTWLQLSDLKGWQCEAAVLYGIQGIPMNFLLDPNGKIIAKGLRGADLDKKLEEVLVTGVPSAGN